MNRFVLLAALLACAPPAKTQESASLTARFTQLLLRASNGHSPTQEEINSLTVNAASFTSADLRQALPLIQKALNNADVPVRAYTLTTLVALQDPPSTSAETTLSPSDSAPENKTVAPPPAGPSTYKPDFKTLLGPAVPEIAAHLTEESGPNRILAASVLGGFTPNPPAAVYPPLLAFLKRDDAVGPVGLIVVQDLLQLAPLSAQTSSAISAYLGRSDQTAQSRPNLVDAIASAPNQSQSLNRALLSFLDTDDANLRARVILSLPALDLSPDVFADTRSRVAGFASNDQENLQVISAAKAVASCWTATRMPTGCPVYQ